MEIKVYTTEQIEKLSNWTSIEEGIYDFEVTKAEEKLSKKGTPMMELILKIWDKNNKEKYLYDYLVDVEGMAFKIRHFWECVGAIDVYENGRFMEQDCIGKSGKCEIKFQKSKNADYKGRMGVADYIASGKSKKEDGPTIEDEDIPF